MPELIAAWRAAMAASGKTTREVNHDAGLGEGYLAKILCGLRSPTAPTVAKINRVLGIEVEFVLLPIADAHQGRRQVSAASR